MNEIHPWVLSATIIFEFKFSFLEFLKSPNRNFKNYFYIPWTQIIRNYFSAALKNYLWNVAIIIACYSFVISIVFGSDECLKSKAKGIKVHFCKMIVCCSTLAIFPLAISGILSILQTTIGFFLWSDFPEFPTFALDLIKVSDHITAIQAWILSNVSSCEKCYQSFFVVTLDFKILGLYLKTIVIQ